jgi:hypothetical protein
LTFGQGAAGERRLDLATGAGQRSAMDDNDPHKDDSLDKPEPDPAWLVDDGAPLEDEAQPADDAPLTTAEFHNIAQKQILNAVFSILSETKMSWELVAPFFESAREVCIGDIEENAQVRLHSLALEDEGWVEAREAYIGFSVSDREDGQEWLSDTRWLSEIAIAEEDPEQVRAIVKALERTIAKLNAWLADQAGGSAPAEPPSQG